MTTPIKSRVSVRDPCWRIWRGMSDSIFELNFKPVVAVVSALALIWRV